MGVGLVAARLAWVKRMFRPPTVAGNPLSMAQDIGATDRMVMRVPPTINGLSDLDIINALNKTIFEEIIHDPISVHHETVPYEHLVACGQENFADSLRETLPKFFSPLAYRPLSFSVDHVPENKRSVLFGDMFETGLGGPTGQAILTFITEAPDAPGTVKTTETVFPLHKRQGRIIVALSEDEIATGLPRPEVVADRSLEGSAFVVTPGKDGPQVELRALRERSLRPNVETLVGTKSGVTNVTPSHAFSSYLAEIEGSKTTLRLIPDTSFSRPVSGPRTDTDQLEVIGVFVPNPAVARAVTGVAVRFSNETELAFDPFRKETGRMVLVGRQDRHFLRADGTIRPLSSKGHIPGLGLQLQSNEGRRFGLTSSWALLSSENATPMARISLRLADNGACDPLQVSRSSLRYKRPSFVTAGDTTENGAAIYVDWLDAVVSVMLTDAKEGVVELGLAEFVHRQGEAFQGELSSRKGAIQWARNTAQNQELREGATYRLGPLLVRLRRLASATGDLNATLVVSGPEP